MQCRSILFVLATFLIGMIDIAAGEEQRAKCKDGSVIQGGLQGDQAQRIHFQTDSERHALDSIQRIEFPRSSPTLENQRPARMIRLQDGSQVLGEVLRFTEETIEIKARGNSLTLPRKAVRCLAHPPGYQQLFYENFNTSKISSELETAGKGKQDNIEGRSAWRLEPSGSLSYKTKEPLAAGRLSLAVFDPEPPSHNRRCGLELRLRQQGQTQTVTLHLASEEKLYRLSRDPGIRLTMQPRRRSAGWQQLTVLWDETRFQILLGSHLLAFGPGGDWKLEGLRLFAEAESSEEEASENDLALGVDDLQISAGLIPTPKQEPAPENRQSQAVLINGDVIFGRPVAMDSQAITLQGGFGEIELPWHRVSRVCLGNESPALPVIRGGDPSPRGWHGDVVFQRYADWPAVSSVSPEKFPAVLHSANAGRLELHHARLGNLQVPLDQVASFTPRFWGISQTLLGDAIHLGNQTRRGFRSPEPLGTKCKGEFPVDSPPEGRAFLRIAIAEMEPAGPDTPPGSRFLSELRNGFLGTEIFLNGRSLGRLNDLLSRRSPVDSPQTVRLPIPPGLLKRGKNEWHLEQTPREDDPHEFDDCEIGPIFLEVEEQPAGSAG